MPRKLGMGVLADDLTGALASAARLAEGGWHPRVIWRETPLAATEQAVVVDMRTRDYGADPANRAGSWARHLNALGCGWTELRIDSTLRGTPAAELAAVRAVLRFPTRVLVVPAFPEAGRVVRDGRLRASVRLPGDDDVARVLFGRSMTVLGVELIDRGPQAVAAAIAGANTDGVVADGTCEAHLRCVAEAAQVLAGDGLGLLSVSPGAWLRYLPAPAVSSYALVVLSSATATNQEQLDELRRRRPVTVAAAGDVVTGRVEPAELFGPVGTPTVVLETISEAVSDPVAAWLQSSLAARAAEALLVDGLARGVACVGIVVGGGQTASAVMDMLGAGHLVTSGEVAPLCPLARVAEGTWAGLRVITKGGLVGDADTLTLLVDTLWKELT